MKDYKTKIAEMLAAMEEDGRIYREVDGFYVWHPGDRPGSFEAHHLQAIVDRLAELNEPWRKQLEEMADE